MKLLFRGGVILSMFLFFFGCHPSPLTYRSSRDEQLVDKITEKTAKKLKAEKNLYLVGTGGQMMHDIQMLAMSFDYYQLVDLNTARQLMVSTIKEYLLAVNNNTEIRPYLHKYPFTAKNLEIRVWVHEPNGANPPLDKVYYFSAIGGKLAYYLDLPETYSRQAICEETYEEALKVISSEQE
ncbi:MAG TPA: hypothetical protein PKW79_00475 [Rhabdochlamydiaceae bacterium]|nr:hypothetical protein [Rhabdochlamydiaceae bacterium]